MDAQPQRASGLQRRLARCHVDRTVGVQADVVEVERGGEGQATRAVVARVPIEQACRQGGLQVRQPLADRRGGDEFALRRAPDAAELAHRHEELQRGQVHAAGKTAFGGNHGGIAWKDGGY